MLQLICCVFCVWGASPSQARRGGTPISSRKGFARVRDHVTFGRLSFFGSQTGDSDVEFLDRSDGRLDTSGWVASTNSAQILSDQESASIGNSRGNARMGVASHWNEIFETAKSRRQQTSMPTAANESQDTGDTLLKALPPPEVLQAVSDPLVPTDIWSRLTGWEFDVPSVLQCFSKSCIQMATNHAHNKWVAWKPAGKRTSSVHGDEAAENQALQNGAVLVYLGKFQKDGYGSQLPLVKTRSLVPLSPLEMAELLMDSSRVQTYNKMSLGRSDLHVMQKGIDSSGGPFGNGETKIVRNLTKPPLSKQKMEFVTMMHARSVDPVGDHVQTGGYLVVSRAVGGTAWGGPSGAEESLIRNEILLGINLIQPSPTGNEDESLVTAVTHVYSPSVPVMLAGKVGVKGAIDFVKDIRKLNAPVPA